MRQDWWIVDERWLIEIAAVIGIGIALILFVVQRRSTRLAAIQPVVWMLLIGQAVISCWTWIALGRTIDYDSARRFNLRFEFGWIVLVLGVVVCGALMWRRRPGGDRWRTTLGLSLIAVVASQAASTWLNGYQIRIEVYVPILIVIIGATLFPLRMQQTVVAVLVLLASVCAVSLATYFFDYSWAELSNYRRIPAPFIDGRLKGVTSHPNVLAPLASLGLILTLLSRRRKAAWVLAPMFAFTLWLTDGRTQIVMALVVLGGLVLVDFLKRFERTWIRMGALVALAAAVLIGVVMLGGGSGPSEFQTLNGRTRVWEDAIEYWRSSPVWGVGPEAFDWFYRRQPGLGWAYGAHNQILQTLAGEGIVGLVVVAMSMMVFVSIAVSATGRRKKQLVAVGLVALATMMVESPLWLDLYIPEWFLFVSVIVVLFTALPDDERESGRVDALHTAIE